MRVSVVYDFIAGNDAHIRLGASLDRESWRSLKRRLRSVTRWCCDYFSDSMEDFLALTICITTDIRSSKTSYQRSLYGRRSCYSEPDAVRRVETVTSEKFSHSSSAYFHSNVYYDQILNPNEAYVFVDVEGAGTFDNVIRQVVHGISYVNTLRTLSWLNPIDEAFDPENIDHWEDSIFYESTLSVLAVLDARYALDEIGCDFAPFEFESYDQSTVRFFATIKKVLLDYRQYGLNTTAYTSWNRIQFFTKFYSTISEYVANNVLRVPNTTEGSIDHVLVSIMDCITSWMQANEHPTAFLSSASKALEPLYEQCGVQKLRSAEKLELEMREPLMHDGRQVIHPMPHFVAFIDILGFTKIIEKQAEENDYGSLLFIKKAVDAALAVSKDELHRALAASMEYMQTQIGIADRQLYNSIGEMISFRAFSDCVTFAMPYHSNQFQLDYLIRFMMMISVIRRFQFELFKYGYLTRGGVSDGSYFSDSNIIFSDGLLSAYGIEKNIVVPAVGISPAVVDRIENIVRSKSIASGFFYSFGMHQSIIREQNDRPDGDQERDLFFIHPFGMYQPTRVSNRILLENLNSMRDIGGRALDGVLDILNLLMNKLQVDLNIEQEIPNAFTETWDPEKMVEIFTPIYRHVNAVHRIEKSRFDRISPRSHDERYQQDRIVRKWSWVVEFLEWFLAGSGPDKRFSKIGYEWDQ